MEKIDPYNHKAKWLNWKEKVKFNVPNVSRQNSDLILKYLNDMENGLNVASGSVKGSRSYTRLNTIKDRMIFLSTICQSISIIIKIAYFR
jgi:hypothetical protein